MTGFCNISVLRCRPSSEANRTKTPCKADMTGADEKCRASWEKKQLVSDWWFAEPASSSIHDQGRRELGRSRRPKVTDVGSLASGQTWSAGSGLAANTAPCASGYPHPESGRLGR